jgi:beta-phosphoglucomutase
MTQAVSTGPLCDTVSAVIFDMDGVVVDSEPLHEAAQAQVFDEYDLPVPATEYATFKGRPERDVFAYILQKYDPAAAISPESIIARKHALYRTLLDDATPVEGAIDFIAFVAARVPVGLTTSAARDEQRRVFDLFDLHAFFRTIISADEIKQAKPHPEPYLRTLRGMNAAPETTLVIEDSVLGVQSALAAGCIVAGLAGTFSAEVLREAGAHLAVNSFTDLKRLWG